MTTREREIKILANTKLRAFFLSKNAQTGTFCCMYISNVAVTVGVVAAASPYPPSAQFFLANLVLDNREAWGHVVDRSTYWAWGHSWFLVIGFLRVLSVLLYRVSRRQPCPAQIDREHPYEYSQKKPRSTKQIYVCAAHQARTKKKKKVKRERGATAANKPKHTYV